MKIWSVFSLVILFHLAIVGLLFIQPGCQSPSAPSPDPSITALPTGSSPSTGGQSADLDPSFNSGLASTSSPGTGSRVLSSPTRPTTQPRAEPDTGLLQPITDPSRDTFSLPPVSRTYDVQRGDTLTAIANKQGVPLSALLSANGLTRNSVIYVGQSLLIPEVQTGEGPSPVEYSSPGQQVVVARGDSLSSIAARNRTTVQAIKSLNGLTSDTIIVGQTLNLPVTGSSPAPTSQTPSSTPPRSSTAGMTSYTVKAGDTPGGIASRHGISARELMALNNISDPRRLSVGQQLVIPGGSSPTGTTAAPPQQRQPDPSPSAVRPSTPPSRASTGVPTAEEDPMSSLEALDDDDLPFVEVEAIEDTTQPQN